MDQISLSLLEIYSLVLLIFVAYFWGIIWHDEDPPSRRPHLKIRTVSKTIAWSWYEERNFDGYR